MMPADQWNAFVYADRKTSRIVGFVFSTLVALIFVDYLRASNSDPVYLTLVGVLTWSACAGILYLFNKSPRTRRFTRYSRVPVPIAIYEDSVTVNGLDIAFHNEQFNFLNAGTYHRGPFRTLFITYTQHDAPRRSPRAIEIPYPETFQAQIEQLVKALNHK